MLEISYIALFMLLGVCFACIWQMVSFAVDAVHELASEGTIKRSIASRKSLRLRGFPVALQHL